MHKTRQTASQMYKNRLKEKHLQLNRFLNYQHRYGFIVSLIASTQNHLSMFVVLRTNWFPDNKNIVAFSKYFYENAGAYPEPSRACKM